MRIIRGNLKAKSTSFGKRTIQLLIELKQTDGIIELDFRFLGHKRKKNCELMKIYTTSRRFLISCGTEAALKKMFLRKMLKLKIEHFLKHLFS